MQESSPYRMAIDLNTLEHLGINLYSNIAAVLTEVVANAWDADAENIKIFVNADQKEIRIPEFSAASGVLWRMQLPYDPGTQSWR